MGGGEQIKKEYDFSSGDLTNNHRKTLKLSIFMEGWIRFITSFIMNFNRKSKKKNLIVSCYKAPRTL